MAPSIIPQATIMPKTIHPVPTFTKVSDVERQVLRIGTRESKLARRQTDMVMEALAPHIADMKLEIVALSTNGDKVLDRPIAALGGTGVFVKELEDALLADSVDFV